MCAPRVTECMVLNAWFCRAADHTTATTLRNNSMYSLTSPREITSARQESLNVPSSLRRTASASRLHSRKEADPSRPLTPRNATSVPAENIDYVFKRNRTLIRNKRLNIFPKIYVAVKPNKKPIEKLQRIARTVRVVAGICLALKSYVKEGESKQWSLIEMQLNLEADMKDSLAFDINLFKKFRVTRGSEKLKNILLTQPAHRSKEEIQVVMALLRHNKTFQEYPLDTQLDLIKCMVYQRYEARRIVLKQGHRPFAFYIILSGTCLVNVQEVDSRTGRSMVRTVREITGGDQFGEIAFMNNCTRTASIVCKDDVELLVIHAEDFNRIIRVPLERKREDHIDFCKRLDMFRNWPVEKLRENRQGFIYQYFKQDSVIVEDTRTANYIIIVKAGRCKVVAKIHELKARRRPSSGGRAESNFPLIEMQKRREAKMPRCLSVITPRDLSQFITTSYRRRPTSRLAVTPTHLSHDHREETRHVNRATVPKTSVFVNPLLNEYELARRQKMISTLEIMMGKKSSILKKSVSEKSPELEDSGPSVEKKVKFPSDGIKRTWKRLQVAAKNLQDKEDGSKQKQLLVHPNRVRTVFAQIATMTPGAVFGLESVKSTSNLSLISEGAECILVSKKLFLNEASSKVMQSLSIMENDFPSPEAALQEIRRARNWEKYKTRVVRDVVSRATKNF